MTTEVFEALYRGEARPPWDQDQPSPLVVALFEAGQIRGRVLDAGCGTGENALYLAGQGLSVVGVDGAPTAVERARDKARARGQGDVAFHLADARELGSRWEAAFDVVVDSGLFHVFGEEADRLRYAEALAGVLRPGGVVHLICFSDQNEFDPSLPRPTGCGTHGVSREELLRAFAPPRWALESLTSHGVEVRGQERSFCVAALRLA